MLNRSLVDVNLGESESEGQDELQRHLSQIVQANRFISENYDKLKQTVISHDTEEFAVISPLVIPPEIE